jgi:hypothetical protein
MAFEVRFVLLLFFFFSRQSTNFADLTMHVSNSIISNPQYGVKYSLIVRFKQPVENNTSQSLLRETEMLEVILLCIHNTQQPDEEF